MGSGSGAPVRCASMAHRSSPFRFSLHVDEHLWNWHSGPSSGQGTKDCKPSGQPVSWKSEPLLNKWAPESLKNE